MFKDLFSLQGRVALVTGGSRGIGKMIAAGFLAQGAARVYITARKAGPCEATAKELTAEYDGECIALPIDISTVAGCEKLAGEIIKAEPKLDILVNNAGAAWGAEFDEFPESGWDKVISRLARRRLRGRQHYRRRWRRGLRQCGAGDRGVGSTDAAPTAGPLQKISKTTPCKDRKYNASTNGTRAASRLDGTVPPHPPRI
jgi:NAD(P)-dependent dehydrogenase (short-subunit alcohol dehydrogenase family)